MNETLLYRIALASVRGMCIDLAQKLLDVIPDERTFFELSESELRAIVGGRSRIIERAYRNEKLEQAKRELEFIESSNVEVIYYTEERYPRRLLEASDAPILLYTTGNCDLNRQHIISMVGTRHSTSLGMKFCDTFVGELRERLPDAVIVSGLAYGIDITSHRAALRHGLTTVAVMPRGLNKIYPPMHRNDAASIVHNGGMLVTEYQSQDRVYRGNFLARNRIIAALSDATVVVESAANGGAMVTASLAQNYNRDVFAIPGRPGDEFSTGCNRLISMNRAGLITSATQLIEAMRWDAMAIAPSSQPTLFPLLSDDEQRIVDVLKDRGEMHINDIATTLGTPVYRLLGELVELECRNVVASLPGCRYSALI